MLRKNLLLSGQNVTDEAVNQYVANYSPVRTKIINHLKQTIDSVAAGQDPISIELSRVFHNPINHDQTIYKKAIERRKLGNPPGKKKNCIGDEINWEIIKSICRGGNEVFIISKDSDFWIKKNGSVFLHPLLQHECDKEEISIKVFNDLILAYREYNSRATEALVEPADLPMQGDELSVPVSTSCKHRNISLEEIGSYTCHVCLNCGMVLSRMLTFCFDD